MQSIPLVRASSLLPLFEFLEQAGSDLRSVRERIAPAFRQPEVLLPVASGGALLEDAARGAGLEDLGLRLGSAVDVDRFGRWGLILERSATAGAFLQAAIASYRAFNTGYHLWTVRCGTDVWLYLSYSRALQRGRSQAFEYSLLIWLAALRRMLGPGWRPSEIHLESEPPRHAEQIDALALRGARFHRPTLAIAIPQRDLARGVASAPGAAAGLLAGPHPAGDLAGSLLQTVIALLRLGQLGLGPAAEAAGLSERSFQRRLGEAGLSFSAIVDTARFELARQMLADPAAKVIDVSAELGYGDAANFTRAFRRWTGRTPSAVRKGS